MNQSFGSRGGSQIHSKQIREPSHDTRNLPFVLRCNARTNKGQDAENPEKLYLSYPYAIVLVSNSRYNTIIEVNICLKIVFPNGIFACCINHV